MDIGGLMNMGTFAFNMLGGNGLKNLRNLFAGLGRGGAGAPGSAAPTPPYQRPWGPVVPGPYGSPVRQAMPGWGYPANPNAGMQQPMGVQPWSAPVRQPGYMPMPAVPQQPGTGLGGSPPTDGTGALAGTGALPGVGGQPGAGGGFTQYLKYLTPENIQQWMQWFQIAQQLFGKGSAAGVAGAAAATTAAALATNPDHRTYRKRKQRGRSPSKRVHPPLRKQSSTGPTQKRQGSGSLQATPKRKMSSPKKGTRTGNPMIMQTGRTR